MNYNAKFGLLLFAIYLLFYCGFMFLVAFSPSTMERTPLAGINLAILYGISLIIGAFILAIIYGIFCRKEDEDSN